MRDAFTLGFLLPGLLAAQISLLRVRPIDMNGAARAAGSRSAGFVVEVTDELGKPVPGAVVTVRLPDDGPSGAFANGLSSDILTTHDDGRAATTPVTWNRLAGSVEIRITAVSGRLRAGTVASCSLSEAKPEPERRAVAAQTAPASTPETHGARVTLKDHASGVGGGHLKWILVGAAAAGAAVATLGLRGGGSHATQQTGSTGTVSSITAAGAPSVTHP
jgi:hypothetical protein